MSAVPLDTVDLLMAIEEAIALPYAATVGDNQIRRAALPVRPYTTWEQAHGQPRPGREGGPS